MSDDRLAKLFSSTDQFGNQLARNQATRPGVLVAVIFPNLISLAAIDAVARPWMAAISWNSCRRAS